MPSWKAMCSNCSLTDLERMKAWTQSHEKLEKNALRSEHEQMKSDQIQQFVARTEIW